jgi:hypothetical protein
MCSLFIVDVQLALQINMKKLMIGCMYNSLRKCALASDYCGVVEWSHPGPCLYLTRDIEV